MKKSNIEQKIQEKYYALEEQLNERKTIEFLGANLFGAVPTFGTTMGIGNELFSTVNREELLCIHFKASGMRAMLEHYLDNHSEVSSPVLRPVRSAKQVLDNLCHFYIEIDGTWKVSLILHIKGCKITFQAEHRLNHKIWQLIKELKQVSELKMGHYEMEVPKLNMDNYDDEGKRIEKPYNASSMGQTHFIHQEVQKVWKRHQDYYYAATVEEVYILLDIIERYFLCL